MKKKEKKLTSLTIAELKEYAKKKKISLKAAKKKAEIIAAIEMSESAPPKEEKKKILTTTKATVKRKRKETIRKTEEKPAPKRAVKPLRKPVAKKAEVKKEKKSEEIIHPRDAHELSVYGSNGSKFDEKNGKILEERSKFYLAPKLDVIHRPVEHRFDTDERQTIMRAVLRDPENLYVYWDITDEEYHRAERELLNHEGKHLVLRVVTIETGAFYEFDLSGTEHDRYIEVRQHGVSLQLSLWLKNSEGQSVLLVSSNCVDIPHISPDLSGASRDEQLLFALSLGVSPEEFDEMSKKSRFTYSQVGSDEFLSVEEELMRRMLAGQLSSHLLSSVSSAAEEEKREKERGFRLQVGAELIVYGSTEPDARVSFQGREVQLDAEGNFRFYLPFPDGTTSCPVTAHSADGVEKRAIDLCFKRSTSKEKRTYYLRG